LKNFAPGRRNFSMLFLLRFDYSRGARTIYASDRESRYFEKGASPQCINEANAPLILLVGGPCIGARLLDLRA